MCVFKCTSHIDYLYNNFIFGSWQHHLYFHTGKKAMKISYLTSNLHESNPNRCHWLMSNGTLDNFLSNANKEGTKIFPRLFIRTRRCTHVHIRKCTQIDTKKRKRSAANGSKLKSLKFKSFAKCQTLQHSKIIYIER